MATQSEVGPWRHVDGTECVSGFSEHSGQCTTGGGTVFHKAALIKFNEALAFVRWTAAQPCQCEQPALPVTGGPACASCDAKNFLRELEVKF